MLRVTLQWTSILSRGGVEIILLVASTGINSGLMGHLHVAHMQTLPYNIHVHAVYRMMANYTCTVLNRGEWLWNQTQFFVIVFSSSWQPSPCTKHITSLYLPIETFWFNTLYVIHAYLYMSCVSARQKIVHGRGSCKSFYLVYSASWLFPSINNNVHMYMHPIWDDHRNTSLSEWRVSYFLMLSEDLSTVLLF